MKMLKFQKISLILAGLTAVAIGLFILVEPYSFYEAYRITLQPNPNLLSDLRGQGANLAALGVVIIAGVFYSALEKISAVIATTVFIAFPVARAISIVVDGMPSGGIISALIIEVVIAVTLLLAFAKPSKELIYKNK